MGTNRYIDDHTTLFVQDGDTAYASDVNNIATITNTACDRIQAEMETYLVDTETHMNNASAYSVSAYNSSVSAYNSSVSAYNSSVVAANNRDLTSGFMDTTSGFMDTTSGFMDTTSGFMDNASGFMDTTSGFMDTTSGFMDNASGFMDTTSGFMDNASAYSVSAYDSSVSAYNSYTSGVTLYSGISGAVTGVNAVSGISGSVADNVLTIRHTDTSSQESVNNSGATVIQDVTLDGYGHITALGNVTLTYSTVGAAASSHTHSTYLPLAGGTMSGPVNIGTNRLQYDSSNYPAFRVSSIATVMEAASGVSAVFSNNNGLELSFNDLTNNPIKGLLVREGATTKGSFLVSDLGTTLISGGNSVFLDSYTIAFSVPTAGVVLDSNGFYPSNSPNLGLNVSQNAWNNIYYTGTINDISDERLKNIFDIGDVSWLYDVNPISFVRKDGDDKRIRFGFGAQSLYEILPERLKDNSGIVAKDFDEEKNDYNWAVSKTELIAPMIKLIQEQKAMIDDLTARVTALEGGK